MKETTTIVKSLFDSIEFDKLVNAHIKADWKLIEKLVVPGVAVNKDSPIDLRENKAHLVAFLERYKDDENI